MTQVISDIQESFEKYFHQKPRVFRAPGRINLIGEHTDYNDGFVLPAAIDKAAYAAIAKSGSTETSIIALDFNAKIVFDINDDMEPLEEGSWQNYPLGVLKELRKKHRRKLEGFNLIYASDIPIGAGMSSSAAVECSIALAIISIFDLKIEIEQIPEIAQKADHNFVGVKSGIMDQFASCMGRKDHFMRLDCRTLQYSFIPADLKGYSVLLFDTKVKHELVDTEYNLRRQQCEIGVAAMKTINHEIKSLRDASPADLEKVRGIIDPVIFNRCKYVIEENMRVWVAASALSSKDLAKLGDLMYETHKGLKKLYEVSCPELDALARMAYHEYPVVGARMMGGGFGGCTINIIESESIDKVIRRFQKEYHQIFNDEFDVHYVSIEDGVSEIT